ncbi:hypothetical protein JKP88DRAFT_163996 [Tribonema minus]|uniref:NFACT RNA-binding domain-containing protein n=1 Tax=Tribonema minus TaxID=303371 RepID=A0A835YZB5_9STRA|nr:hypothetical protein JKP88DRAFT_163996 [Tribonema minus]
MVRLSIISITTTFSFASTQVQKGGSEAPKGKKGKKPPAGKGGKGGPAKADAQQKGSIKGLTQYRTPEAGVVVLVGRNNLQNERITFQVARAHDIWLHARGVPGSHVLVRCDPGQDLPDADLKFAADVAAYFSKARNSSNVPVDRVSPKGISRVPGAGPGMVQFDKTEVIWGDPRRAQALLEGSDAPVSQ